MALALDSKAFFMERVRAIGLGGFETKFEQLGWTNMGMFAFSANHAPGKADEQNFEDEVIIPLLESSTHIKKPAVRRLFTEAYAMAMADASARVNNPDSEDKPKKLPLAERVERMAKIKKDFTGLKFENNLEPSHQLVDKFVDMLEVGEVRPLPWEELTKRTQENIGQKKEPLYGEDGSGVFKRLQRSTQLPCP